MGQIKNGAMAANRGRRLLLIALEGLFELFDGFADTFT